MQNTILLNAQMNWCQLVSTQSSKNSSRVKRNRKPLKIKDLRIVFGCGGRI